MHIGSMNGIASNGRPPRHSATEIEQGRSGADQHGSAFDASYASLPSASTNPSEHGASARTFPGTAADSSSMASDRSAHAPEPLRQIILIPKQDLYVVAIHLADTSPSVQIYYIAPGSSASLGPQSLSESNNAKWVREDHHCRWLVGTPDLSDWLHFWKLKHGSKAEGYDPAVHFKVRHKQHWTPDRGPGEPLQLSCL